MLKKAIVICSVIFLGGTAFMGVYMIATEPATSPEQDRMHDDYMKEVIRDMKYYQGPNPRLCFGQYGPYMVAVDCELVKDRIIK